MRQMHEPRQHMYAQGGFRQMQEDVCCAELCRDLVELIHEPHKHAGNARSYVLIVQGGHHHAS